MADPEPLLRSLGITLKSPFDWRDQPTSSNETSTPRTNSSPATASTSGLDALKTSLQKPPLNDSSDASKDILRTLLSNAGVSLNSTGTDGFTTEAVVSAMAASASTTKKDRKRSREDLFRDVSIRGLSDRAVGELAVEGKTSLFGSILRMFDFDEGAPPPTEEGEDSDSDGAEVGDRIFLSTAEIVRTCHLAARSGDVPPGMDSKEYTMAALHFLSSAVPMLSEGGVDDEHEVSQSSMEGRYMVQLAFPVMPLLKVIDAEEPLEKRSYGRIMPPGTTNNQPESMDQDEDFRRKVLNMERSYASSLPFDAYWNSSESAPPYAFQRYVARRKLCPRLDEGTVKEELTLMISGHLGHALPSVITGAQKAQQADNDGKGGGAKVGGGKKRSNNSPEKPHKKRKGSADSAAADY